MEELLKNLKIEKMNANEIIEEIMAFYGENRMTTAEILTYPQFVQDIYFLDILEFSLVLDGDVLVNHYAAVPHMITALHNISASHDAEILQKIYDEYTALNHGKDNTQEEIWSDTIDELYEEMWIFSGVETTIGELLEKYIEREILEKEG
ncbi:MAG: hypothetical protein FWG68_10335 [Defluviitaleaceae bacterium]|nr:hypothetical protein [Defluviitaleaceae bacterium]